MEKGIVIICFVWEYFFSFPDQIDGDVMSGGNKACSKILDIRGNSSPWPTEESPVVVIRIL